MERWGSACEQGQPGSGVVQQPPANAWEQTMSCRGFPVLSPWGICVYFPGCPTLLLLGTVFTSCLQRSTQGRSEPAGEGPELNLQVHLHRAVCLLCHWWGGLGDPLHTQGWNVGLGAPLQLLISGWSTLELCHAVLNTIPLSCSPPQVL